MTEPPPLVRKFRFVVEVDVTELDEEGPPG
jgi:hypothetical protein